MVWRNKRGGSTLEEAAKRTKLRWMLHEIKRYKLLYAMMAPFLLLFLVFVIWPVIQAVFFSFTDYNVMEKANFVGFRNYRNLLLQDKIFIKALKNTIIIACFVGPGGYILSFLLAWLINELPHRAGTVLTVVFYAPSMAGTAATVFRMIFANDSKGYLNAALMDLGVIDKAVYWLSDESTVMWVIILVSLWLSLGVGFLSFVAGIKNVDEAQYEAAAIDGIRNRWQELWYITLPNMKPQLLFGAVMSITGSLSVGAMCDAIVGFPSPNYASHTIVNHLNDYGMLRLEMGYACAIAVILFSLMMVCNLLVQRFLRKLGT